MLARFALALCLVCFLSAPVLAEELTTAKRADIRLMLEASGGVTMGKQMSVAMSHNIGRSLKAARPDLSSKVIEVVEREIATFVAEKFDAPGGVIDKIIPMYAEHFTHQEVREMLAFYQSPVGRKAVATMPQLYRDGQKLGQEFAREIGPELKARLDAALAREGVSLEKK